MFSTKYVHCIMAGYKNNTLFYFYMKPIRLILVFKVFEPYVTFLSYTSHDSSQVWYSTHVSAKSLLKQFFTFPCIFHSFISCVLKFSMARDLQYVQPCRVLYNECRQQIYERLDVLNPMRSCTAELCGTLFPNIGGL